VPSAIAFQAEHNWQAVRQDCHALLRTLRPLMQGLTGLPPITPDSDACYAQMAAFSLPPCDGEALKRRLYDEFSVEVPVTWWHAQPLVRVSVQGYNAQNDLDRFVEALRFLLPRVRR
jgi:isopenicillin-N epimerase